MAQSCGRHPAGEPLFAPDMMNSRRLATLLLGMMFIVPGLLLIPYLGMQEDEVMFATDLFLPDMAVSRFIVWPTRVVAPSMLMSYVGALKSWIYAPLLHFLKPSAYMLRMPVLLMAAVTIYLFFEFVRGACGTTGGVDCIRPAGER